MIIFITREIGQVNVYGANGDEWKIREVIKRPEIEALITCKPNEAKYLSGEHLEILLLSEFKEILPNQKEVTVNVY